MIKVGLRFVLGLLIGGSVILSTRISADTITLSLAPTYGTSSVTNFDVPTNVTAQIVSSCCYGGNGYKNYVTVTINGATAGFLTTSTGNSGGPISNPPIITGPATISLVYSNGAGGQSLSFCTIQTTASYNFTPSTAVVIPNDSGGPVTIVLESSTDLINWSPALPGTYGTASSNRFFRVKAQR